MNLGELGTAFCNGPATIFAMLHALLEEIHVALRSTTLGSSGDSLVVSSLGRKPHRSQLALSQGILALRHRQQAGRQVPPPPLHEAPFSAQPHALLQGWPTVPYGASAGWLHLPTLVASKSYDTIDRGPGAISRPVGRRPTLNQPGEQEVINYQPAPPAPG